MIYWLMLDKITTSTLRNFCQNNFGRVLIGRFESLPETFNKIQLRLKSNKTSFPHKIKGCGEDYKLQYDKESIELVKNFYSEEIQLFDYSFDS